MTLGLPEVGRKFIEAGLFMTQEWQTELKRGVRALEALADRGLLSDSEVEGLQPVVDTFDFFVTEHYLNLVDPHDPSCPIALQALPSLQELQHVPGELGDPIGDSNHEAVPGVVHRYPDRALLFLTLQCPMLCRFCFRKVFLNEGDPIPFTRRLEDAMSYFQGQSQLREIILSGGDPFLLSDRRLKQTIDGLEEIPHIRSIRMHTRALAALPSRFTRELLDLLDREIPITVVAHVNHPREWTETARKAARALRKAGVQLLSQSVLLKDINDSPTTLKDLFLTLSESGCTPYYLHHPDLTVGTQHLRVSIRRGIQLIKELRGSMSGHAIPTYVLDLPGGFGKIPVDSSHLSETDNPAIWTWTSPHGETGTYTDLA